MSWETESFKNRMEFIVEYLNFMKKFGDILDYQEMDSDLMIDELKFITAEYFRLSDPLTIEKIREGFNEHFNEFWYSQIANTHGVSMPSEKKYNEVFQYYFDKEDFEKCEVLKKAKIAHDLFEIFGDYDVFND
jgi:hypothetical protein